jgi:hypothetical protein
LETFDTNGSINAELNISHYRYNTGFDNLSAKDIKKRSAFETNVKGESFTLVSPKGTF